MKDEENLKDINSHFVPQCYLRSFARQKDDSFFRHKIKSKYPTKIRTASVSSVCYKPNFYRIKKPMQFELQKLNNQDYFEEEGFREYENNYPRILSKMASHKPNILTSEAALFFRHYFQYKKKKRDL